MAKWKLFGKTKEDEQLEPVETVEETEAPIEEIEEVVIVKEKVEEKQPLAEYHETLETGVSTSKRKVTYANNQRIWRDVYAIEGNIDNLHLAKARKPHSEVEKTVDKLIDKRKFIESEPSTHRKPSNVIYVVSKPQPGEVRGDWAVRNHGKIFSHHKTKEKAIDSARKVAKKRKATVMVQNTDGTFSDGFKPR